MLCKNLLMLSLVLVNEIRSAFIHVIKSTIKEYCKTEMNSVKTYFLCSFKNHFNSETAPCLHFFCVGGETIALLRAPP